MNTTKVQNNGLGVSLLANVNTKTVNTSKNDSDVTFGEFMSSQVKKGTQTDTVATAKETTKTADTKKTVSQEKTSTDNYESDTNEAQASETERAQTEQPQDVTEDAAQDVAEEPVTEETITEEQPIADIEPQAETAAEDLLTEDQMDTIKSTVEELMENIKEELDVTDEELTEVMELLNIQPVDLLQPQVLTELVTELNGADSAIELLTDADMYEQLCNLTDMAEESMQSIMEETGLSAEELTAALEQMNATEGEEQPALVTQQETQELPDVQTKGESKQDDMLILLTKDMTDEQKLTTKDITKEPVKEIQTDEQTAKETVEAATDDTTEEDAANAGTDASQDETATQDDTTLNDYQNTQDSTTLFQKGMEQQTTAVDTAEVLPTQTTDTTDIIRQIADYVKVAQTNELTEMELQLHPSSLGNVHIKLSDKNGEITAQITTQNETVKNAVEAQVVQLKSSLEEQGVKVEAVEVSVASHEMEKNLDSSADEQKNQEGAQAASIKKLRRTNLNLNLFNSEEEFEEAAAGLDDAARIAMELMKANGNSVDLLA